jgi:hypothetical protein
MRNVFSRDGVKAVARVFKKFDELQHDLELGIDQLSDQIEKNTQEISAIAAANGELMATRARAGMLNKNLHTITSSAI